MFVFYYRSKLSLLKTKVSQMKQTVTSRPKTYSFKRKKRNLTTHCLFRKIKKSLYLLVRYTIIILWGHKHLYLVIWHLGNSCPSLLAVKRITSSNHIPNFKRLVQVETFLCCEQLFQVFHLSGLHCKFWIAT